MTGLEKQIKLAEEIAHEAHEGQVRSFGPDGGLPYVVHCERVAKAVGVHSQVLEAVAWLHDVLEDTRVTSVELLNRGVSPSVVSLVQMLTHKPDERYVDYILRVRDGGHLTTLVKRYDIADNLSGLNDKTHKQRRDKYELALAILEHR